MTKTSLLSILAEISHEDRENLAWLLELEKGSSVDDICECMRWRYQSKIRAMLANPIQSGWKALGSSVDDDSSPSPTLYWEDLVAGLARSLKVYDPNAGVLNELYISHAIIVRALGRMTPQGRKDYFQQPTRDAVIERGKHGDNRIASALRPFGVLGLANSAGFSLYTASTTALGFVTHAVGVTLPFSAYIGLTSSIAVMIGPVGWLAASGYAFWKLTSPEWKKLMPAIVYIIDIRAAWALKEPGC